MSESRSRQEPRVASGEWLGCGWEWGRRDTELRMECSSLCMLKH